MNVTTVVCGTWHSGAVDDQGNLYTWGRGDQGQLGTGQVRFMCWVSRAIIVKSLSLSRDHEQVLRFLYLKTVEIRSPGWIWNGM